MKEPSMSEREKDLIVGEPGSMLAILEGPLVPQMKEAMLVADPEGGIAMMTIVKINVAVARRPEISVCVAFPL